MQTFRPMVSSSSTVGQPGMVAGPFRPRERSSVAKVQKVVTDCTACSVSLNDEQISQIQSRGNHRERTRKLGPNRAFDCSDPTGLVPALIRKRSGGLGWGGGVSFRLYANALGWSLAARRLVERGDLCIAQSAIVQTDIIEAAVEPMRHMKPAPTNGGWHARLGRD